VAEDRQEVTVTGRVTSAVRDRGTGNEHTGVVLETEAGERFFLVPRKGNPFNDPETRKLVGQEIEVTGYLLGAELRYTVAKPKMR